MGQYYRAVNVDKQVFATLDGAKLMEFSWVHNKSVAALVALMAGEWKGDRVYIVGDYADSGEFEDKNWRKSYDAVARELGFFGKTRKGEDGAEYETTLYGFAGNNFKEIFLCKWDWRPQDKPIENLDALSEEGLKMRYVINDDLGVYIDLQHCPADNISYWKDEDRAVVWRVHPMTLLLAMGNGRGGGDYNRGFNREAVGAWTASSNAIRFAKEGEEAKLEGLKEYAPYFAENETPTPWQEIDAKVAEVLAKGRAKKA